MSMTINTNVASLNAQRNLSASQSSLAVSMQRLSSGLRVNSAKDDAAGLAIADRMNAQVRGMNVAIRNANDGISFAQTAEGALATVTDALQRMRELAVQHASGQFTVEDKANLAAEFTALNAEITDMLATTYNGQALFGATVTFQVGANAGAGNTVDVDTTAPAISATITDITTLDADLEAVSTARATLGASMSALEMRIKNLQIGSENQAAAHGRIMDADFAVETANLSRAQILQQAGSAMVAQANQLPNQVMALLR